MDALGAPENGYSVRWQKLQEGLVPKELERAYASLLKDMHLALLSEFGSRAIYDHLSRRTRNGKLTEVLVRLNAEGAETVSRLREVMASMGARPKRTSLRRRGLARVLSYLALLSGPGPVLRLCHHAEDTVSRWYAEYAIFLSKLGDLERAAELQSLHTCKRLRAQELAAWMELARHR